MLKLRNTLPAFCVMSFAALAPLAASADETDIFGNSNIPRLEGLLVEHICSLTDGGCVYTGQDMDKAHAGLGIDNRHFNALVEDLRKAMDDNDIPFRTQNKLLALLAPMHGDITKYPDY